MKKSKYTESEITEKLKYYKKIDKLDCFDLNVNTHIRYFEYDNTGNKLFRVGGFIKDKNWSKQTITLSNSLFGGFPIWEIYIDKCDIYKKITIDEIYIKYKILKTQYKNKCAEYDSLFKKYNLLKSKNTSMNTSMNTSINTSIN